MTCIALIAFFTRRQNSVVANLPSGWHVVITHTFLSAVVGEKNQQRCLIVSDTKFDFRFRFWCFHQQLRSREIVIISIKSCNVKKPMKFSNLEFFFPNRYYLENPATVALLFFDGAIAFVLVFAITGFAFRDTAGTTTFLEFFT